MTLIHVAPQVPLPDRLYQGRVQLLEVKETFQNPRFHQRFKSHVWNCRLQGNWRHAVNNRPVSREELMMVLADLVGLRINALYFTQSQRLTLGEVGLEETTREGTGGPGNTVEQCSCPPQYTGDSCEVGIISPGNMEKKSHPAWIETRSALFLVIV